MYIIRFYLHSNIFIMIRQLFVPDFHSRIAKNWRKVPSVRLVRCWDSTSAGVYDILCGLHDVIYILFVEVFWNRGTPSHHPFIDRFSIVNHPALGLPPWLWNPPYIHIYMYVYIYIYLHECAKNPSDCCTNLSSFRTLHWCGIDRKLDIWDLPITGIWATLLGLPLNHRYHRHGNWYLGTPIDLETLTSRRRNTKKTRIFPEFKPQKTSISMARVSPWPFGGLHLWSPPGFPKRPQWIWGKFRKMMAFLSIDLGFGWIWDDLGLLHLETKIDDDRWKPSRFK